MAGHLMQLLINNATESFTRPVSQFTFSAFDSLSQAPWNDVVWGFDRWVSVSTTAVSGTSSYAMVSVTNGTSWALSNLSAACTGVSHGLGRFVAVGGGSSYVSTDGVTWTQYSLPTDQFRRVDYVGGLFVATGWTNFFVPRIATSTDGQSWTSRTIADSPATATPEGTAYGGGVYVMACRSVAGNNRVLRSTDGETWDQVNTPTNGWLSVAYGNGVFVCTRSAGATTRIMYSSDGSSWTSAAGTHTNTLAYNSVVFGNGIFLASADGNTFATSSDGVTWTDRTVPVTNNWVSAAYGDYSFVAVAPGQIAPPDANAKRVLVYS